MMFYECSQDFPGERGGARWYQGVHGAYLMIFSERVSGDFSSGIRDGTQACEYRNKMKKITMFFAVPIHRPETAD